MRILRDCTRDKFKYKEIISDQLFQYLENLAISKGTNLDYLFLTVITAVNFILAKARCKVDLRGQDFSQWLCNLNTYSIFVGPPTTNKSGVLEFALVKPFNDKNLDIHVVNKPTTSALAQALGDAETDHAVILENSEISELLASNISNSKDSYTGDISLLNKIYSGEQVKQIFSTRQNDDIPADSVLCIIGKIIHFIFHKNCAILADLRDFYHHLFLTRFLYGRRDQNSVFFCFFMI